MRYDLDTIRERHIVGPAYRTNTCVHGPEDTPGECDTIAVLAALERAMVAAEEGVRQRDAARAAHDDILKVISEALEVIDEV